MTEQRRRRKRGEGISEGMDEYLGSNMTKRDDYCPESS
jgi:hypothetical protein